MITLSGSAAWLAATFASGILWYIHRNMLMMLYISKTFSRLVSVTFADVCSRNKINGCCKTQFILFLLHNVIFWQLSMYRPLISAARGDCPVGPITTPPLSVSIKRICFMLYVMLCYELNMFLGVGLNFMSVFSFKQVCFHLRAA